MDVVEIVKEAKLPLLPVQANYLAMLVRRQIFWLEGKTDAQITVTKDVMEAEREMGKENLLVLLEHLSNLLAPS